MPESTLAPVVIEVHRIAERLPILPVHVEYGRGLLGGHVFDGLRVSSEERWING